MEVIKKDDKIAVIIQVMDIFNEVKKTEYKAHEKVITQTIEKFKSDQNYKKARAILDKALFSCQYWAGGAVPWWDPRLVEKGVRYLTNAILALKKLPEEIKNRTNNFYFQIVKSAFELDELGIARQRSIKYTEKVKKEVAKFYKQI